MRILYAEDNEVNQALLERVVRARGWSIVFRSEGQETLDALAADPGIDLILLDIELADACSGFDVIAALRARGDQRPVVAITAYAMRGDRERILAAGCDGYLAKPLEIPALLALLDQHAPKATVPAPAAQTSAAAPSEGPAPAVAPTVAPAQTPAYTPVAPTVAPPPSVAPVTATPPAPAAAEVAPVAATAMPPAAPLTPPAPGAASAPPTPVPAAKAPSPAPPTPPPSAS